MCSRKPNNMRDCSAAVTTATAHHSTENMTKTRRSSGVASGENGASRRTKIQTVGTTESALIQSVRTNVLGTTTERRISVYVVASMIVNSIGSFADESSPSIAQPVHNEIVSSASSTARNAGLSCCLERHTRQPANATTCAQI